MHHVQQVPGMPTLPHISLQRKATVEEEREAEAGASSGLGGLVEGSMIESIRKNQIQTARETRENQDKKKTSNLMKASINIKSNHICFAEWGGRGSRIGKGSINIYFTRITIA